MKQISKKKVSICFPFCLPSLCRPSMTSAVVPSILPKFSDARILIIEDEVTIVKVLSRNISTIAGNEEKEAHSTWISDHITSTDNGDTALEMFTSAGGLPFDILFVDNNLKGKLMGFEVALELRERGYNGPIVMATSSNPDELGGLNLTEVIKDESRLKLKTLKRDRYGSTITERTHEAYLLPKPAKHASLEMIIKAHFIMPDPKPEAQKIPPTTVSPALRLIELLNRSPAHDSVLEELSEHRQLHLSTIVQHTTDVTDREEVSRRPIPTVTFGTIPTDSTNARENHIYASAMTQLQDAASNSNGDAGWAYNCLAIATQALTLIKQKESLASLAFNIILFYSEFFG